MKNRDKLIYFSVDGLGTGKVLEQYLFQENPRELLRFSSKLTDFIQKLDRYMKCCGGTVFLSGGDNILALLPLSAAEDVIREVDAKSKDIGLSFSIGMGYSLTDTYLALKYAKTIGGDPVVTYVNGTFQVLRTGREDVPPFCGFFLSIP